MKSETKRALREFVYEDLDHDGLARKIKNIERHTEGANPHNIGMAASGYLSSTPMNEETERAAKETIIETFPTRHMKRVFSHELVDKVKDRS